MTSERTSTRGPSSGARAGRRAELEQWIARVLPKLRSHVRLTTGPLLRSRESVSDIVQSALREACVERDDRAFPDEASFRRYVYAIAARKIVTKSRRHLAEKRDPARERPVSDRISELTDPRASAASRSPSRHAERSEDLERLARAFAALDEEDQRILSMRRVFDIPVKDIARELDLAESTVRWRLATILAKLASRIG